jgi:lysine-specific demethylase 8
MRTRGREGGGDDDLRAYLAQHDLFESVPELEDACRPTPPYVGAGAMKRVWIGPANTKTPLHRDPYHNVLCQVWGRKKVICYHARDESKLYPYPSGFLKNTSRVVNVDDDGGGGGDGGANAEFPDFAAASRWEIALDPGDALFLPARTWHHVRSLTPSLSVSYWWGGSRIG